MTSVAHTSEVIAELAVDSEDSLTVRDIIAALGDRAYALLIVVFAIPSCLPMPPPIPLICGFLLAFIAVQLILGWQTPWFPRAILSREVNRRDVARVAARAIPIFRKLEKYSRPRLKFFIEPVAYRMIGVLLLCLAIALVFSPPFIGQIPLGFAICLIGLGIVERDGLISCVGLALGGFGASLSYGFIYALVAGFSAIF
ncbi:exopolysaccharide biosynthesis protein [Microvirga sp. W0021]|uniref:Exopolysaccharide biosynthesis protein n=1 Tax=Hohaiivirga grylli TaxID=3133970 RepID=A0ABV0BKN8_9HYPH